jgi:hypothetical protein
MPRRRECADGDASTRVHERDDPSRKSRHEAIPRSGRGRRAREGARVSPRSSWVNSGTGAASDGLPDSAQPVLRGGYSWSGSAEPGRRTHDASPCGRTPYRFAAGSYRPLRREGEDTEQRFRARRLRSAEPLGRRFQAKVTGVPRLGVRSCGRTDRGSRVGGVDRSDASHCQHRRSGELVRRLRNATDVEQPSSRDGEAL